MKTELPNFTDQVIENRIIETLIRDGVEAYEEISDIISEEDFYSHGFKQCYKVLQKHFDNEDRTVDRALLANEIKAGDLDADLPSLQEIETWRTLDINTSNVVDFAKSLKSLSQSRYIKNIVKSMCDAVIDNQNLPPKALKEEITRRFFKIEDIQTQDNYLHDLKQSIVETYVNSGKHELDQPFPTGFTHLDNALQGGFQPKSFNVIGARTGMGKSILANQIILNMIMPKIITKPFLLFSLEMDHVEVAERNLSYLGNLPIKELREGHIQPAQHKLIQSGLKEYWGANPDGSPRVLLCDKPDLTIKDLESYVFKVAKRYGGVGGICVDYLQFMSINPRQTPAQAYGDIAKALKSMAEIYKIPVIAVCQLNRDADKGNSEEPKASDIKDSGMIEQTANTVTIIKESKERGLRRIYLVKNRIGDKVAFETGFYGEYSRFDTNGSIIKVEKQNNTNDKGNKYGYGQR